MSIKAGLHLLYDLLYTIVILMYGNKLYRRIACTLHTRKNTGRDHDVTTNDNRISQIVSCKFALKYIGEVLCL